MKRTLIENADWIITMNSERERIRHGDIVYEDYVIREVGTNLKNKYDRFDETIDASGMIVTPGFINTHHHTWQSLIRNIKATQGLTLEPWLTECTKYIRNYGMKLPQQACTQVLVIA